VSTFPLSPRLLIGALFLVSLSAASAESKPAKSDIAVASRRLVTTEVAARLTTTRELPKLPDNTVNPFSPSSFNAPDPEEMRIAAEAARRAKAASGPRPTNDRDLLTAIAGQIKPTGMVNLGGEPILLLGTRKIRVGDPLSASFEGKTIAVKVTAIDRTSFTLRLNGEEFTRPIKSGNNP